MLAMHFNQNQFMYKAIKLNLNSYFLLKILVNVSYDSLPCLEYDPVQFQGNKNPQALGT